MFDDPPPIAFKLMRRLKASFDPMGIFNPGCFVGGL
jgi:FAD/FMN-containing dehydrogenase